MSTIFGLGHCNFNAQSTQLANAKCHYCFPNCQKMGLGDYPEEYDPKTHGPYDPSRYYGNPDIPFSQVKLGELGTWFRRRNKSPRAIAAGLSRAWWKWQLKYVQPKRAGIAPFLQITTGCMVFFYLMNYQKISRQKNYKYH